MISTKSVFIMAVVGSFAAGSFVASPELRAYAVATITSADIVDNTIQSVDIKDGDVKAVDIGSGAIGSSEIATNAVKSSEIAENSVGASELIGVTNLKFADCPFSNAILLSPGGSVGKICSVAGANAGDNVVATKNGGNGCFIVHSAVVSSVGGEVTVSLRNECTTNQAAGTGTISIIVFHT